MKTQKIEIGKINPNASNPRVIKEDKFLKLVQSIKDFPEMLDLRPLVLNKENVILGGNMRYKACVEAGVKEIPCIIADKLTPEQEAEFIIKDNVSGGEWDWDVLANEWDSSDLDKWGLDLPLIKDIEDISEDIPESMYKIEVTLNNESEQEKLYNKLIEGGYECRLLTL